MARKFAEIAFTDSLKAAQRRYGSRRANEALERSRDPRDRLTAVEIAFIHSRDSFYQATVSETGWHYVQFRGGPAGFLRVLDARTLAYADFRGNLQYLSVGNIAADHRVALILMDYARRRRLKIWARASIVDRDADPDLVRRVAESDYAARIERAVVMNVAALDWNCPQHIMPRFTTAEIEQGLAGANARPAAPGSPGSCDIAGDLRAPRGPILPPGRPSHDT